jgi:hypothetical protein
VGGAIPLNAMGADYDLGGIPVIPPEAKPSVTNYGPAGLAQPDYGDGRLDT